jgi:plasmid stabilization system protein ParE
VAQVVYAARAIESLERAFEVLLAGHPAEADATASATTSAIESAVGTLAAHPLLGRRVEGDLRELIISFGATGYVALYRFVVQEDQVRVLALRHQREIGYLP